MVIKIFTSLIIINMALNSIYSQYDDKVLEKLGWKLACQAYTFKNFTFTETLDKLDELGIQYLEMYPGQLIGGDIEGDTHYNMDGKTMKKIKELIDSKGIKLLNYGVTGGKDETEWRQLFEFSKFMGIQTILAEPVSEQLDMISGLCDEYNINVALHNHPKPSIYWDPDVVIEALKGRSDRLGAAPDFGHWVRSGLNPIESLKKLEGQIISIHIKDINKFGARDAHDLPWGTGVCNIAGIMHELKKQKFEGVFSIEYEYNWDNSMSEIAESIAYFYRVAYWLTADY